MFIGHWLVYPFNRINYYKVIIFKYMENRIIITGDVHITQMQSGIKIIDLLSMVKEPDYSKKFDYDAYIDKMNELVKKYNVKFLVGDLII